jgi:hypothetical protein
VNVLVPVRLVVRDSCGSKLRQAATAS